MSCKFDAFFTHDWGTDELGRDNHARVRDIVQMTRSFGLNPWFDETQMTGNIMMQMADGIEQSACVVVFVTQRYMNKVSSPDDDNCKSEFGHAKRIHTANHMIPVVMEKRMSDTSTWQGNLGLVLGDILYVKAWDDHEVDAVAKNLLAEIARRVPHVAKRCAKFLPPVGGAAPAAAPKPARHVNADLAQYLASLQLDVVAPALADMEVNSLEDLSYGMRQGIVSASTLAAYGIKPMVSEKLLSAVPKIKLQFDVVDSKNAGGHRWFYEGEVKNGKANGQGSAIMRPVTEAGRQQSLDGSTYTGQWLDNCRHGQGVMTMETTPGNAFMRRRVTGQWSNDQPNGQVAIDYHQNSLAKGVAYCRGYMVDWLFQGQYELFYNDVPENVYKFKHYSGGVKDSKWQGYGTLTYFPSQGKGAQTYQGEFNQYFFSGQGTLTTINGTYVGQFAQSKKHGRGSWTPTGGRTIHGVWNMGTQVQ